MGFQTPTQWQYMYTGCHEGTAPFFSSITFDIHLVFERYNYRPYPKDGECVMGNVCPFTGGAGGGTPVPGSFSGEYPVPGSFPGPFLGGGTPVLEGVEVTLSQPGGTPGQGYPCSKDKTGVPPARTVVPPSPPRASTCYVAGGMPLAVTQEDFLVLNSFFSTSTTFSGV